MSQPFLPSAPRIPGRPPVGHVGPVPWCRCFCFAILLIATSVPKLRAADATSAILPAEYRVVGGKLQFAWKSDPKASTNLTALYGGDGRLAEAFANRTLTELNDRLLSWDALTEWKVDTENPRRVRELVDEPVRRSASTFNGSLADWVTNHIRWWRVQTNDQGVVVTNKEIIGMAHWVPVPDKARGDDADAAPNLPFEYALPAMAYSLIASIDGSDATNLRLDSPGAQHTLRFRFHRPVPITNVVIAPRPRDGSPIPGADPLDRELDRIGGSLSIAWNDDIVVRRIRTLLHTRGMWIGTDLPEFGGARQVSWITTSTNTPAELTVHLPHLCYILFDTLDVPEAELLRVARILLGPGEFERVEQAVRRREGANLGLLPVWTAGKAQGRFIDLFAAASLAGFPPMPLLPVTQDWVDARTAELEQAGYIAQASATRLDDRIVPSSNARRKLFERGGVDIVVTRRQDSALARRLRTPDHPPALCYVVAGGESLDDDDLARIAGIVVGDPERRALAHGLGPESHADKIPATRWTIAANGTRFLDLYSVGSDLRHRAGATRRALPFIPVNPAWVTTKLRDLRTSGYHAVAEDADRADRFVTSRNRDRLNFEQNGVLLVVTGKLTNGVPADALADTAGNTEADNNTNWFSGLKYTAEIGVSIQDTQPAAFRAGATAFDPVWLGKLGGEVRYQREVSGRFTWNPAQADAGALPSSFEAFHDVAPRRAVAGTELEIERQGGALGKQWSGWNGAVRHRYDAGIQYARVRNLQAPGTPTANEVRLPAGLTFSGQPNRWDAREHWRLGLRLTPSYRDGLKSRFWMESQGTGQLEVPLGGASYFGEFDVQWAAGDAPGDALPYVGGSDGVRGIRPFGAPSRARVIVRNELWFRTPFVGRDAGASQGWFGALYEVVRPAVFVDAAWATGIRESVPADPWFASPGAGIRLILGRQAHLSIDYAYGIANPHRLGGHRVSLGVTTHF